MLSGGMTLQPVSLSDYAILLFCPLIHFSYNKKLTCFALLKSKLFRYLFYNNTLITLAKGHIIIK